MTTMHPSGGQGQDLPVPPVLNSTIEDLLAQVEHEYTCRRREARALRRRLRRQRRREQPLRTRAARFAGKTGSLGLALIGTVTFVAAAVVLVVGDTAGARDLFAVAAAAWGGASAARMFRA